jgi:hypothetical protein
MCFGSERKVSDALSQINSGSGAQRGEIRHKFVIAKELIIPCISYLSNDSPRLRRTREVLPERLQSGRRACTFGADAAEAAASRKETP